VEAAASSAFQTEGVDVELVYIQSTAAIAALVPARSMLCRFPLPLNRSGGAGGRKYHDDRPDFLNKMIFSFHAQKEFKSAESCGERLWAQIASDRRMITGGGVRTALTQARLKTGKRRFNSCGSADRNSVVRVASKQIAASALTHL